MRFSFLLLRVGVRPLAGVLWAAGLLAMSGCASAPQPRVAEQRPAVLVLENLGNCAWRVSAVSVGHAPREVTVPVGETVRLEVPAGSCAITQEALAGLDPREAVRHFVLQLAGGETYHWRLVTLASVAGTPH